MKRLIHTIKNFFTSLGETPSSFALWLLSFTTLIIGRLMIEFWLGDFETRSPQFLFYEFTHTFFFFLFSFLVLWPITAYFWKTNILQTSNILLFGFLIILTPPLLDTWITQGAHLWSFYKFDSLSGLWHRYFTLFGDRPDMGITYGVRIEVVIITIFVGLYTYLKTKSWLRAAISSVCIYSILFILGTFPSWLTFALLGFRQNLSLINEIDIAQLFLSPPVLFNQSHFEFISALNIKMSLIYAPLTLFLATFYLWRYFPKRFFALAHNARVPQICYHGGLFFIGIGLALKFADARLTLNLFNVLGIIALLIAIGCAWLASVIANDLFDQNIDNITNTYRPLPQKSISLAEYRFLGITFFLLSLVFASLVSFKSMLLLLAYQALAWMYSAWPLRIKRFPLLATLWSAIASVLILIIGFVLVSPDGTITKLPNSFIAFFLFILMVSLPLKDFKDIAGDKADHVYTIPVLFGEQWGKMIIGSGIFLSYILSVSVFHESKLIIWALMGGSASFWVLMLSQSSEESRLSYRKLPGWLLGIITLYMLILIQVVS